MQRLRVHVLVGLVEKQHLVLVKSLQVPFAASLNVCVVVGFSGVPREIIVIQVVLPWSKALILLALVLKADDLGGPLELLYL